MVAVKAHQAESFLKPPRPRVRGRAVLRHRRRARRRARSRLASLIAAREDPPGEIIRLDDADLDSDPDRLAVELQTMPMFGGSKIVRAIAGRRITAGTLQPLIDGDSLAATLIVEAGNLRPNDSLRALFEKSAKAAAVACYPDEVHDLETLIRETLKGHGLTIAPRGARSAAGPRRRRPGAVARRDREACALRRRQGRDRCRRRGGHRRRRLRAHHRPNPQRGSLRRCARAVAEFARAVAAGESPQAIIAATQRYFQRLHRIRADIDQGRSFEDAIRQLRPAHPLQAEGCHRPAVPHLDDGAAGQALSRAAHAAKAARLSGPLEEAIAEELLMGLAAGARQGARR